MQKLLFTASTYSHILNFHLPYLQYFEQQGWTLHLACGGEKASVPHVSEVIHLPLEKSMTSPKNFRAAAMLREKIKQESYSLIITHTALAAFFTRAALWGLRDRPPLINMVHGYLFDEQTPYIKQRLLLTAEEWTASQTDLLITMNQWDYHFAAQRQLGRRVSVVPGVGVDFSRFDHPPARPELRKDFGIPQDAFLLLYPAEFSARKSQPVLIRALAELPEDVFLVLAGDGRTRTECESLAETLGLQNRILFPGHQQDMASWYAVASAAVTSSRIEGMPFNVMEAMYTGLPVVASAVKGHTDLISHETTGLLYPYGDSTACAAQIQRLITDPSLCRRLSDAAGSNIRHYRLDEVFPIVLNEYLSLLPDYIPA